MFFPASEWLTAFFVTLLIEVPLAGALLWRWVVPKGGVPLPRLAALVGFANLASHPLVWFVFTQLFLVGTIAYTLAAEGWAFGIEAAFYAVAVPGLQARRAVLVSLAANLASFLVGRLLWQVAPDLLV
ncbi:MAG: hypothetical protein ACYDAN_01665 [Candidatus Limnocylindrales bacterium]